MAFEKRASFTLAPNKLPFTEFSQSVQKLIHTETQNFIRAHAHNQMQA